MTRPPILSSKTPYYRGLWIGTKPPMEMGRSIEPFDPTIKLSDIYKTLRTIDAPFVPPAKQALIIAKWIVTNPQFRGQLVTVFSSSLLERPVPKAIIECYAQTQIQS